MRKRGQVKALMSSKNRRRKERREGGREGESDRGRTGKRSHVVTESRASQSHDIVEHNASPAGAVALEVKQSVQEVRDERPQVVC